MDRTHLTALLRSRATTPRRRAVARALAGFALAGFALTGALHPLLGITEIDAKRNKKKKRRRKKRRQKNQPFCAGKNTCTDGDAAICGDGALTACVCLVTMRGEPFCGDFAPFDPDSCSQCRPGEEECLLDCSGGLACLKPCPNPL